MAYPSAVTLVPGGKGKPGPASRAYADGNFSFCVSVFFSVAFPKLTVPSPETASSSSNAMSARSTDGCTATTYPVRVRAPNSGLARTSTMLCWPARHATCAQVSTRSSPPFPSSETTTPEPLRDDARNGIFDVTCGATTTVAARAFSMTVAKDTSQHAPAPGRASAQLRWRDRNPTESTCFLLFFQPSAPAQFPRVARANGT
mmetsp:Transcript_586/g.2254  ORF Transcript_586/g.2254 Transcript_586/m.2254 type:complete len:202 (-) Transcript_586:115-720(-)